MLFKKKVIQVNTQVNRKTMEKPKLCLFDIQDEASEHLKELGFNIYSGSLGAPIKVPNSQENSSHTCFLNCDVPANLHEFDILIIDMKPQEPIDYNIDYHRKEYVKGSTLPLILSSYPETLFDPRAVSSYYYLKPRIENSENRESLVIIFSYSQEEIEYQLAEVTKRGLSIDRIVEYKLYDFYKGAPINNNKFGKEVFVQDCHNSLQIFLNKFKNEFEYRITFSHPWEYVDGNRENSKSFIPLLIDIDNDIIAYLQFVDKTAFFVFPQLENKPLFLGELLTNILPEFFPHLFPFNQQFAWLKNPEYYLPQIAEQKAAIEILEREFEEKKRSIEENISQITNKYQFLHDLLSETGDKLVQAVISFLLWLGFDKKNVIDVDTEKKGLLEEDIQVKYEDCILVIEVKGIGGTSKDSECSQINKIKYRRAKELKTFEIYGLYLVNNERFLPPKDRTIPPFDKQKISDADNEERGLLTTYQLFKLFFWIEQGIVTKEDARNSLIQIGLVKFTPSNSISLGKPLEIHYSGNVIILEIENTKICIDDELIIEDPFELKKVTVQSIRVGDSEVEEINKGKVGLRISKPARSESVIWKSLSKTI